MLYSLVAVVDAELLKTIQSNNVIERCTDNMKISISHAILPVCFEVFKAVEVEDADNSSGCVLGSIHSNGSVNTTYYQLEQPSIQCL